MGVQIISRGRIKVVAEAELSELRERGLSWFKYSQYRLTMDHQTAIARMMRFRGAPA